MIASIAILVVSAVATAAHGPLREIEGDATQSVCGNVVVHANAAIAAAVRGDAAIGRAVVRLRSIDFDEAAPTRKNGVDELVRFASDAGQNAARGAYEIKRLSELAERSQAARDELRAFTAPLHTAFELQRKTVDGLTTFLETVESYDIRQGPGELTVANAGREPLGPSGRTVLRPIVPGAPAQPSALAAVPRPDLASLARSTASDVELRTSAVTSQESRAAEHAEAAVRGCS